MTDWESGTNNNLTCWIDLWGTVREVFKPAGKQVAMSVDDSVPHKESLSDSSWSYLSDWDMFTNITDVLINMGTCELRLPS